MKKEDVGEIVSAFKLGYNLVDKALHKLQEELALVIEAASEARHRRAMGISIHSSDKENKCVLFAPLHRKLRPPGGRGSSARPAARPGGGWPDLRSPGLQRGGPRAGACTG